MHSAFVRIRPTSPALKSTGAASSRNFTTRALQRVTGAAFREVGLVLGRGRKSICDACDCSDFGGDGGDGGDGGGGDGVDADSLLDNDERCRG